MPQLVLHTLLMIPIFDSQMIPFFYSYFVPPRNRPRSVTIPKAHNNFPFLLIKYPGKDTLIGCSNDINNEQHQLQDNLVKVTHKKIILHRLALALNIGSPKEMLSQMFQLIHCNRRSQNTFELKYMPTLTKHWLHLKVH